MITVVSLGARLPVRDVVSRKIVRSKTLIGGIDSSHITCKKVKRVYFKLYLRKENRDDDDTSEIYIQIVHN